MEFRISAGRHAPHSAQPIKIVSLHIEQSYSYQGDDWWKWAVWLGGSDTELDNVLSVEYRLHPTFPNPVRTSDDRESKFLLKTQGWGVFPIHARVTMKDGQITQLKHQLVLRYDDGTPTTA
jgi:transcription initiation factor IIF auxiliary subunit